MKKARIISLIKEMKKSGKSDEWIYMELRDFILPSFGWVPKTSKDLETLRKLIKKVK